MASATRATRVMLPKAVTKSLHANSRCSLPFTKLQPLALGSSAEISVSVSFFAGMAASGNCFRSLRHYAAQAPVPATFSPSRQRVSARAGGSKRFFVECLREFLYRRGFFRDENARCVDQRFGG